MATFWHRGFEARYTGHSVLIDGRTFHEAIYLEGPQSGSSFHALSQADVEANTERKRQEWREQQRQFARLHK